MASVLIAAIVGGAVATGVTLAMTRGQSRTNPQRVDLSSGVTINEDDATMNVAAKAAPAVVSIVTQDATLAHGAGFLVTSDGYIVTNVGVVANAQTLTVILATDSKRHDARLVDYDCTTGVAVLKVDRVANLPTLSFDSASSLRTGQTVIVRGGLLNDGDSVTRGVISALHSMPTISTAYGGPAGGPAQTQMSDVIQTDAKIDSGVSGAPLLDVGGQVIGVTMTATSQGQPLSIALPASDVQPEVEQIIQSGGLVVPSLGAQAVDVSADTAVVKGDTAGARIMSVDPGGPAAKAGLQAGDVITQLDDQRLDDAHPLAQVLRARYKPDQRVTVSYMRAGTGGQVQFTLLAAHPACGSGT